MKLIELWIKSTNTFCKLKPFQLKTYSDKDRQTVLGKDRTFERTFPPGLSNMTERTRHIKRFPFYFITSYKSSKSTNQDYKMFIENTHN